MRTPGISVQVPLRNGGQHFRTTLASLALQDTGGKPWELVIVDDGSRIPVEEEFADDLQMLLPEVSLTVVRIEGAGNRPAARNIAWQASAAPLSLLIDGDLELPPGLLEAHMSEHETGNADVVMGARINAWMPDASPWQEWFDTRAMGTRPAGSFPWKYFITGNLSIPLEILRETGGFDPGIDRYGGEDTEFGYRLGQLGTRFHWVPELKVYHLDVVTVREHSIKMVEYGASSLKYTLEKHPGAKSLLGSDWLAPVFGSPLSPARVVMRLATRFALQKPVYRSILRYMEKAGRPRFLFTYLSVGACLLGLAGKDLD
jgi:glycosyltransferase involved in cell wall biosynthesis